MKTQSKEGEARGKRKCGPKPKKPLPRPGSPSPMVGGKSVADVFTPESNRPGGAPLKGRCPGALVDANRTNGSGLPFFFSLFLFISSFFFSTFVPLDTHVFKGVKSRWDACRRKNPGFPWQPDFVRLFGGVLLEERGSDDRGSMQHP